MTPVLIDSRVWIKFGFIAVFFSAITFAVGFLLGHQDATAYYGKNDIGANNKMIPLSLPEEVATASGSMETVAPEVIGEGEDIDVDRADAVIMVTAVDDVPESIKLGSDKSVTDQPMINTSVFEEKETPTILTKNKATKLKSGSGLKSPNGISFTPENIDEIKYSIQAGVYGRLSNAENVMKQLKSEKFDAYVTEYLNKNNETRYNVRLGYFVDKRSALPTLSYFRREKNSKAYLVEFSVDTMVDLVDDEVIVNAVDEDITQENFDKKINVLINQAKTLSELSGADINYNIK
jgi:cell division septation protein DedD